MLHTHQSEIDGRVRVCTCVSLCLFINFMIIFGVRNMIDTHLTDINSDFFFMFVALSVNKRITGDFGECTTRSCVTFVYHDMVGL